MWPNVWDMENGKHIKPNNELLNNLRNGGIHQVQMTGADSLISRKALETISYAPMDGVVGEDMCMATRAKVIGLPLYCHADTKIEHRRRR